MHDGAPTELERLTRENAELRAELSRQAQTASELAARIGHSGDGFERLVSARTAELETVTARLLAATSAAKIGMSTNMTRGNQTLRASFAAARISFDCCATNAGSIVPPGSGV